ncbi:MAG: hypothetical protein O3A84_13485 [Proteobacteria bacterium]|nr:hypothetical protein [Pseudomonadota bacterium]
MSKPVVHLVGSIPLKDAEDVFRTVSGAVGANLTRLPDGETGKRISWIKFLESYLNNHPDMETDPDMPPLQWRQWDGLLLREAPMARFKEGVDPTKVTFDTGYGDAAIESFAIFDKLQSEGVIPAGVKFQVCIPTPLAPGYNFVSPNAQDDFIPAYTRHIVGEVAKVATLPHDRIAIQWDVCQEVLMWENYYEYERPNYKEEIYWVLSQIGDVVPDDVDLGYHLCYGSPKDEHLVLPKDCANMVEMMQGIQDAVSRPITFFHIPVPIERDDDAYFASLKDLNLAAGTELYIGCIHHGDEEGDARRLKKAQEYVQVDGVGSECGWGRGDPERVPSILESHAKAASILMG